MASYGETFINLGNYILYSVNEYDSLFRIMGDNSLTEYSVVGREFQTVFSINAIYIAT